MVDVDGWAGKRRRFLPLNTSRKGGKKDGDFYPFEHVEEGVVNATVVSARNKCGYRSSKYL